MTLTVRTFEGDAAEASAFAISAWSRAYAGRTLYPEWTANYFDWQLLSSTDAGRNYLLAAFDGVRMAGMFCAEEFTFRHAGGEVIGTMGSWLTVDPEFRRTGVGQLMQEEMWRRHRKRDARFMIGYVNAGSVRGQGRAFWTGTQPGSELLRAPRFWVALLDGAAVARAEYSRGEALGARAAGMLGRIHTSWTMPADIRPYCAEDLDDVFALVEREARTADLGYVWSRQRLAHQLDFNDHPRTLVLTHTDGTVTGFVNYNAVTFQGRTPMRAAVIDFIVANGVHDWRRLLRAALRRMAEEETHIALVLGPPVHDALKLLAAGFLPAPRTFSPIFVPIDPGLALGPIGKMHLHWR